MKKLVLVFLKFPEPGRVKTRLAKDLGEVEAAEAYRRLAGRVFEVLEAISGVVQLRVLYDPPERAREVCEWLGDGGVEFVAQEPGDLGERLEGAFEGAFADGYEMVAAVGTDCVDLGPESFAATWERLEGADVVFGPSRDGGYYLVGLKAPRVEIFREIPWSSKETLRASVEVAKAAGMIVAELEELRDVDTIEDWREVEGRLQGQKKRGNQ